MCLPFRVHLHFSSDGKRVVSSDCYLNDWRTTTIKHSIKRKFQGFAIMPPTPITSFWEAAWRGEAQGMTPGTRKPQIPAGSPIKWVSWGPGMKVPGGGKVRRRMNPRTGGVEEGLPEGKRVSQPMIPLRGSADYKKCQHYYKNA